MRSKLVVVGNTLAHVRNVLRVRGHGRLAMVPTTQEMQRAELHKTIWRIADDLRGSIDGWDFKSYVLGDDVLSVHLREPR